METAEETLVDSYIQNDPAFADRFDFITRHTEGEISKIQLVREFKEYIQEMLDAGYDVLDEAPRIHLQVFLLTSGYPFEVGNGVARVSSGN